MAQEAANAYKTPVTSGVVLPARQRTGTAMVPGQGHLGTVRESPLTGCWARAPCAQGVCGPPPLHRSRVKRKRKRPQNIPQPGGTPTRCARHNRIAQPGAAKAPRRGRCTPLNGALPLGRLLGRGSPRRRGGGPLLTRTIRCRGRRAPLPLDRRRGGRGQADGRERGHAGGERGRAGRRERGRGGDDALVLQHEVVAVLLR